MSQTNRTAADVLLALEAKIDSLINLNRSQELNIKILSNKVNILIDHLSKQPAATQIAAPQIKIEAADVGVSYSPNKSMMVSSEANLPIVSEPTGARRTSREEDFAERPSKIKKPTSNEHPMSAPQVIENKFVPPKSEEVRNCQIMQRVIDKNSKSVFLAEVEVKSLDSGETIHKTRTNGVGKWMGTLPIGNYRVTIRKQGTASKEKMEVSQDIKVDGRVSPMELSELIIK